MNILHALTSDVIEFHTAKMWGGGPALYERDLLLPPISLMSELGSTIPMSVTPRGACEEPQGQRDR